jgi:hypothetical protein
MKLHSIDPEFVEFVPATLSHGKLYISMVYSTTVHLCACGCGNKVVLPLSPAEWQLYFDGDTVQIAPSVGNGEFPCRSHYWISFNEIRWSDELTPKQIAASRCRDAGALSAYFSTRNSPADAADQTQPRELDRSRFRRIMRTLRTWLKN